MKKRSAPGVAIMPAVKADAYGHGAVDCARALEGEGADWFGVALPEEGRSSETRASRGPCSAWAASGKARKKFIAAQLTPAVFRLDLLERFNQAARAAGVPPIIT